jgi:hypothetical protein
MTDQRLNLKVCVKVDRKGVFILNFNNTASSAAPPI